MDYVFKYGVLLAIVSLFTCVKSIEFTMGPSVVDEGDSVELTCVFDDTPSYLTITIRHAQYLTKGFIWRYRVRDRKILIGEEYKGRVQHEQQLSYSGGATFTLTNVTRDDEGSYQCVLEQTNQETLTTLQSFPRVDVAPRSLRVFITSPTPYTTSTWSRNAPFPNEPLYTVVCMFSVHNSDDVSWLAEIIHGDDSQNTTESIVKNETVDDITISALIPLTRQDNGEKSVRCEVKWRRDTDKERIYTAQLEKPLNVMFDTANINMDAVSGTSFSEGDNISVTCRAGSTNPPQQIDWWIKKHVKEGIEETYQAGEYNGQETVSTLRVTAERWMNGEEVLCCLRGTTHCQRTRIAVTTSISVSPTSRMSTQALSLPVVNGDLLLLSNDSETVTLYWTTPTGDYDKMAVQQCERGSDKCIDHEVANGVRGVLLTMEPGVEYEFFMLLYQAGAVVVKAGPFLGAESQSQDTPGSNACTGNLAKGYTEAIITGGVVVGVIVITLVVAVTVLTVKRRKAPLNSQIGTTPDIPLNDRENGGDAATTAFIHAPTSNEDGYIYDEIENCTLRSSNTQNLKDALRNERKERQSVYSKLGPREAPEPNVYAPIRA